ncbi:MAG TPA: amino acid adenylation domain-containing protein [Herpetosiphonaceae bacterium]
MTLDSIAGVRVSPQQKQVWLLQQAGRAVPFRSQCAVQIDGPLDRARLRQSCDSVVQRFEILRTTFRALAGMTIPLQVIGEDLLTWEAIDIQQHVPEAQARQIWQVFDELLQRPFDLAQGPVTRCTLVICSPVKHCLVISLPALCADLASLRHLVAEIVRSYAASVEGGALDDEPLQYADIAEWQNELLEVADAEVGKQFWRERSHLEALPGMRLAFERRQGAAGGFDLQVYHSTLDQSLAAQLDAHPADTSMLLLTAWIVLLGRHIPQSRLTLGIASDGRKYEELEQAIGLFARDLPLSFERDASTTFQQALDEVGRIWHEHNEWQEYFTWDTVLPDAADGEQPPFFPVCFSFDDAALCESGADVTCSLERYAACTHQFKIKLACRREADTIVCDFHYDARLLNQEHLAVLAEQYQTLLHHALHAPQLLIDRLALLGASERQRLLSDFNRTTVDVEPDLLLHDLFEAQAARTPDAVAVEYGDQRLTYAELNARANQLAHHLMRQGVGPDVLVGIHVERSLDLVIALLGTLKAGGAYVPLEPSHPSEYLAFVIDNAAISVLLTQQHLAERLPAFDGRVVRIDADWTTIAREQATPPQHAGAPDHLAYVLYTSGSTGVPKGVMITHRGLCNHMLWMQAELPLTTDDRVLQKTVCSFDASVWEFYAPLLAGACLVVAEPGKQQDSTYLVRTVIERRITILQLVPAMLHLLLEEPLIRSCTSLKRVFCGGEALALDLQQRCFDRLPADLYNLYGPTETTIQVIVWQCQRQTDQALVPIGRPIWNVRAYILDRALQPVPIGIAGELYIGGVSLARGYVRRADLTAERFIPDPFSAAPGSRLYRTGDLARYQPDGTIEYLGRVDHQVKLRGFRIELGQIEAVLRQHPAVQDAVVMVRDDAAPAGRHPDQRLTAYVIPQPHQSIVVEELQRFVGGKLPDYMIPSIVVPLNAFPLTASGKVDRQALPVPHLALSDRAQTYVGPRNELEQAVAAIWEEVLGVERIGIHDNFFALGGHSLLTTQINARVLEQFQVSLPLRGLFEAPTIAEFSVMVVQHMLEQADPETAARLTIDHP